VSPGIAGEPAIPFHAFRAAEPTEPAEPEVLEDEMDGGVFLVVRPAPGAGPEPDGEVRAGRAVIGLAPGGADPEAAIDAVLDGLAGRPVPSGLGHRHRPASDLEFWGDVDAERGRLATSLDVVVCRHDDGTLSAEAPEAVAAAAFPDLRRVFPSAVLLGPGTGAVGDGGVARAALRHGARLGGRAEVFPGQHELRRDVPVPVVLARSDIDAVVSTSGPYDADAVVRTHGFARPRYEAGRLVLRVGHDDPAVLVPWEVRYSPPCCADG
jgi:hypothetical protein